MWCPTRTRNWHGDLKSRIALFLWHCPRVPFKDTAKKWWTIIHAPTVFEHAQFQCLRGQNAWTPHKLLLRRWQLILRRLEHNNDIRANTIKYLISLINRPAFNYCWFAISSNRDVNLQLESEWIISQPKLVTTDQDEDVLGWKENTGEERKKEKKQKRNWKRTNDSRQEKNDKEWGLEKRVQNNIGENKERKAERCGWVSSNLALYCEGNGFKSRAGYPLYRTSIFAISRCPLKRKPGQYFHLDKIRQCFSVRVTNTSFTTSPVGLLPQPQTASVNKSYVNKRNRTEKRRKYESKTKGTKITRAVNTHHYGVNLFA